MTDCELCLKPIKANTYVRLDDNFEGGKQAHVQCYLKALFPSAKPGEIKVKPVAIHGKKETVTKQ